MTSYPKFDQLERSRIRRALLRYKIANCMKAPELATQISEVNRNHPIINPRRVSRFLANQHDSEDSFVGWCDTFLQSVPPAPDPLWQLAQGLYGFIGKITTSIDLSGSYTLSLLLPSVGQNSVAVSDTDVAAEMLVTWDDGFWRLEERAVHQNAIWDGVLVYTRTGAFAILKERLTGITKAYTIRIVEPQIFGSAVWTDRKFIDLAYAFALKPTTPLVQSND